MPESSQAENVAQKSSRLLPGASCEEPQPRKCIVCGNPLRPRQLKFCSQACNTASWDAAHPRLGRSTAGPSPGPRRPLRERILELLTDGRWRTVPQMAAALRAIEVTVDRKLRDLRAVKYGRFTIQVRPRRGKGGSQFRLELGR